MEYRMKALSAIAILAMLTSLPALAEDPSSSSSGDAARLTFNGYLGLESDYQVTQQGGGDRNGSLDVDVLELLINYSGSDKFRLSGALDWEHGADTEFARGEVTLGWAFLEYTFHDSLKLRAGKMLVPFGVYNEIHGAKSLFLSRTEPQATLKPGKIAKIGYRFAPKWEAGVQALGTVPLANHDLEYVVMIGNGEQPETNSETNPYEEDNNTRKSLTARLQYRPLDNLLLGVSVYDDTLTKAEATIDGSLRSYGAHAKYDGDRWKLLYEISKGRQQQPGSALTGDEVGQVAEVGYVLPRGFIPYVQFQNLSAELGAKKETAKVYIVGTNYRLGGFIFKLEDALYKGSPSNGRFQFRGNRFNQLQLSLFYAF